MVPSKKPVLSSGLVAFADLTRFARNCRGLPPVEVFRIVDEFAELVGEIVRKAGGCVVKMIGDEVLIFFPESNADEGVRALRDCKQAVDLWLAKRGWDSRLIVKTHFGEVAAGELGTRDDKRFDIMGETVNVCALTKSDGFSLTPEAFRTLKPETRKFFKKHTPAVIYIDAEQKHRD